MMRVSACPEAVRLRDLLDGMLPDAEQVELAEHLDQCTRCQQRLETLATGGERWGGVTRLGRWRSEAGPALGRVMAELTGTALDTPPDPLAVEEPILGYLSPSVYPAALGRFGPYEVLEVIGQGGMGVVLKALDPGLNRIVAIKVLAPQLAASAAARKRFAREARAAAAVVHEHVVAIHAVDVAHGLPYLVMQYVPGESLEQRLRREGPLQLEEILSIALQTAQGLAAAHAQGVVHRDVKPANILLASGEPAALAVGWSPPDSGREPHPAAKPHLAAKPHPAAKPHLAAKPHPAANAAGSPARQVQLTDFGLARAIDDGTVTQSGFLPGTPAYMAPEQASGEGVDHRADLFSLGSVMYAMCTGRPPFRASTLFALLRRVSEDQPIPVRQLNPSIPDWLVEIMMKLHAKYPAQRFQTATETAAVLDQCLAHVRQPATAPLPWFLRRLQRPRQSRSRRGGWLVAALLLVSLLGLGAWGAATVLRVKTPEGTLVIEVSDPKVNVTVDGKDVVISGEGIAEVRLRAGQHKVEAGKDGKPILTKIVDIKRDGKEVVRVSLEPAGPPAVEARWWDERAAQPLTLKGHSDKVHSVVFSPDGRWLVSGAEDKTVRVWDVETGKAIRMFSHSGPVLAISLFPDGKVLVTISQDGTVQLWDIATGKALTSVKLPGTVRLTAVDRSSKMLARSGDGVVRIWDLESGKERVDLKVDDRRLKALAFSPDGRNLAAAGPAEVVLWDVVGGQIRVHLKHDDGAVRSLAFSPDGKQLLVGGDHIRVLDAATGKLLLQPLKPHRPACMVQSPDGRRLATGDSDGLVAVVDIQTGEVLFQFQEKSGPIAAVAFSPDGKRLAWAGQEGDIRLAPLDGKAPSRKFSEDEKKKLEELIRALQAELEATRDEAQRARARAEVERARALLVEQRARAAADEARAAAELARMQEEHARQGLEESRRRLEQQLYVRSIAEAHKAWEQGKVKDLADLLDKASTDMRQWEWHYLRSLVRGLDSSRVVRGHTDGIRAVAFSPDGKRLASASYDFTTRVWDVASAKEILRLEGHKETVDSVAFSPDAKRIATCGRDGVVILWDAAAGKMIAKAQVPPGPGAVAFSPDAKLVAWTGGKATLITLDAQTGKIMRQIEDKGGCGRAVAFSPDGRFVAFAGDDLHPRLIEAASGALVRMLTADDKAYAAIAFSPDGRSLAAAGKNTGSIHLFDVATGKSSLALRGHKGEVSSVAFSPDARRLATAGEDGTVRLWDVATGQTLLTLTGHEKGVTSVAFSPDGRQLATGGLDRTIRLWPGNPQR